MVQEQCPRAELHEYKGPRLPNQSTCSCQDIRFKAFHVDLDEGRCAEVKVVQSDGLAGDCAAVCDRPRSVVVE